MFKTVKLCQTRVCHSTETRNKVDVWTQLRYRYNVSESFAICVRRPLQNRHTCFYVVLYHIKALNICQETVAQLVMVIFFSEWGALLIEAEQLCVLGAGGYEHAIHYVWLICTTKTSVWPCRIWVSSCKGSIKSAKGPRSCWGGAEQHLSWK